MLHKLTGLTLSPDPDGRRVVSAAGRLFPVDVARHPRARRYVIRVTPDGRVRLTVPRWASIAGGLRFAARQRAWIAREWQRQEARAAVWTTGTAFWFRGERQTIEIRDGAIVMAGRSIETSLDQENARTVVETYLRREATMELAARTRHLASERGIAIVSVSVRNQRSRWGSCSRRGAIALNWRLIQMPPDVSDYVILHELAHRKHANHSIRFWREVESLCPRWREAERWLRKYGKDLM